MNVFEQVQQQGDQAIRTALLDTASRLLTAEGPQALALRRIASEAGCSTTVLYRMFGGKAGLTDALYVEGFQRFQRRLAAVPAGGDPLVHLLELGRAYRDNALGERNYYGLMFGNPIAGYTPSDHAIETAAATFGYLERAVAACAAAGYLIDVEPQLIAAGLWSAVHGFVGLELAGHLPYPDAVFETVLRVQAAGFLSEPLHHEAAASSAHL